MSRWLPLVLALLALPACGELVPIPVADTLLHIEIESDAVESGRGLPLTVVRSWREDLQPEAWDDAQLAPLELVLLERSQRASDGHVEERRRYRAYAFTRADLRISPPTFTAHDRQRAESYRATAAAIHLRVLPALDAQAPGPPEFPLEPLAEPRPRVAWLGLVLLGALLLGGALARRGRRARVPAAPVTAAAAPTGAEGRTAEARLEALRAAGGETPARRSAHVVAAARILREFVAARFDVPARARTSEELRDVRAPGAEDTGLDGPTVWPTLRAADVCIFARRPPSPTECEHALACALAFVRASPGAGA